ncbi:MAG: ABC transporter ATP-binding protein [Proteobacteria bacterium]|nr:ABC transporter ATP-binding protein [Pseudomonadota bacterium]
MSSVSLDNVFKSFSSDGSAPVQSVIDGLSFSVRAGESVALMGPSGSGKSTILNLIAGLDLPTAGDVVVEGKKINLLSPEEREKFRLGSVSYVFQSFHLLPTLTALENCALIAFEQKDREADEIIGEALRTLGELGIADAAHKYPAQLSGGMQARVALARALVAAPKLVLADEPTGNLDSKTGERVLDFLFQEQAKRKFTLLLVTHDQNAADRAERIIHLRDGRVSA